MGLDSPDRASKIASLIDFACLLYASRLKGLGVFLWLFYEAGMASNDMMTGSRARGERPPSRTIAPKSVMAPYKLVAMSDDFQSFFHGAPSESFWNILLKGIDLSKSRELDKNVKDPSKRIFGNDFGAGFYMDNSPHGALESAKRRPASQHDLLEFMIPRWELGKLKQKRFDGSDAEWAKFVIENKARKAPGEPRPRAYDVDMITGPMYKKKVAGKVLPITERGDQTSIHTAEAAKIFNKYRRRG